MPPSTLPRRPGDEAQESGKSEESVEAEKAGEADESGSAAETARTRQADLQRFEHAETLRRQAADGLRALLGELDAMIAGGRAGAAEHRGPKRGGSDPRRSRRAPSVVLLHRRALAGVARGPGRHARSHCRPSGPALGGYRRDGGEPGSRGRTPTGPRAAVAGALAATPRRAGRRRRHERGRRRAGRSGGRSAVCGSRR